ncbi:MAG TPA: NHLP bacteriocin export ABC transporter permease/ATPase subunit [Longimicrobium sp.]|jgi:NHLM bacteriocin system ABC transporter ATP-binding protein
MPAAPTQTALFERHGTPCTVGGDHPFLLDRDSVWLVRTGHVDVFTVLLRDGAVVGKRRHLFRVDAGRLLLGNRVAAVEQGVGLLAVGAAGTELVECDRARLWEAAQGTVEPHDLGVLLDEWVDLLTGSMSPGQVPEGCLELQPRDDRPLESDTPMRPRGRVAWIRHHAGSSRFLGLNELRVGDDVFLPISHRAWLELERGSRIHWLGTPEMLRRGAPWPGLDRLHSLVLLRARDVAEASLTSDEEWLRRRADSRLTTFDRAFVHLASTMEVRRGSEPRIRQRPREVDADAVSGAMLFAACRVAGEALGIEVRRPAASTAATRLDSPLEAIAQASRSRVRTVMLRDGWWREDGGAMVARVAEDQRPVALVPHKRTGYLLFDPLRGTREPVTAAVAQTLDPRAHTFYRPFGDHPLGLLGVLRFGLRHCRRDLVVVVALGLAMGLLGMAAPVATAVLFNDVIPGAERMQLLQVTLILVAVATAGVLFKAASSIALLRIEVRMSNDTLSAVWDRLLALPMPFFRPYSAGNLATRAMAVEMIRQALSGATITAALGGVFSLFQFILLFHYSSSLALWSVALISLAVLVTAAGAYVQLRDQRVVEELRSRLAGTMLQFLGSIAKLRVAGAEVHAFGIWARSFSEQRKLQFRVRTVGNLLKAFNTAFPVFAYLVLFAMATPHVAAGTLSTGNFLAFLASFGLAMMGVLTASAALTQSLMVIPLYDQARPILQAAPEVDLGKADPGTLKGGIDLQHLVFRYDPEGAPVLRDLTLQIRPGEFVALVGPSGSGKSTLLRLLLGFEQPEAGVVYYDGQDLSGLDPRAVRSQIGVVLQNAQLMPGDILTNIVGPTSATIDDAWAAARMAGLDEDIEALPMGMHTVISEGGGALSGGQRQRLVIARALVRRPRILYFDEATSALDNRTQAIVSASLERLQVTRIAVAHRLSTVQRADRICVIDAGRIVEMGTYDELMAQDGAFAALARRQLA